jgi:hypothetical protein
VNEHVRYTMAARLEQRPMRGAFTATCCVEKQRMPSFISRQIERHSNFLPGYHSCE